MQNRQLAECLEASGKQKDEGSPEIWKDFQAQKLEEDSNTPPPPGAFPQSLPLLLSLAFSPSWCLVHLIFIPPSHPGESDLLQRFLSSVSNHHGQMIVFWN